MKTPKVTGPLFAVSAKGPIKNLGHFRQGKDCFFLTDAPPGNKTPVEATSEMRQEFRAAWIKYKALPLTKPRNLYGEPIYRQPTWGQFWREYWAIHQLGGVFTADCTLHLSASNIEAAGVHALTGSASMVAESISVDASGGALAGESMRGTLHIAPWSMEAFSNPDRAPSQIRAVMQAQRITVQMRARIQVSEAPPQGVTVSGALRLPWLLQRIQVNAPIRQMTGSIKIEKLAARGEITNPRLAARINAILQSIESSGHIENPRVALRGALSNPEIRMQARIDALP